MKYLTTLGLTACAALASPVASPSSGSGNSLLPLGPSVTIENGTVNGYTQSGVDSFLGIPFALPPVGDLRLRKPEPYNKTFGTLQATNYAPGCVQTVGGIDPKSLLGAVGDLLLNNPIAMAVGDQSEDCLYLNVQRPSNISADAKLPVVVWIYGGGFQFGGTSMYDAQSVVERSIALDAPVVYVSMAYRLSGYGWMPGKEMQKDSNTNLGLRDQRLALHWVAENVEAFGGDPDHVVIWGESAGSISVYDHMIIDNGANTYRGKQLFHGAVMNSGSVVPARTVNESKAQSVYDQVASAANCNTANDSLACLRGLSTEDFQDAVNVVDGLFGYQSVNLPFLPRPDPTDGFFNISPDTAGLGGNFAHIPFIIGDQQDEGTLFSLTQQNISTNEQMLQYFSENFFPGTNISLVEQLVNAYPQNATKGSPYHTGDQNQVYPQFKRMAAILGDITFNLIRRAVLSYAVEQVPAWSYINSYLYGTPVLGTFHGADLTVMYNAEAASKSNPTRPIDYFISFFNYLDPNQLGQQNNASTATVAWPQWQNDTRQLMGFGVNSTGVTYDDYRQHEYDVILSEQGKLRV